MHMNEKIGTGVSSKKIKVKESQSRSVTPSLDTPSGARLGASQYPPQPGKHETYPKHGLLPVALSRW